MKTFLTLFILFISLNILGQEEEIIHFNDTTLPIYNNETQADTIAFLYECNQLQIKKEHLVNSILLLGILSGLLFNSYLIPVTILTAGGILIVYYFKEKKLEKKYKL